MRPLDGDWDIMSKLDELRAAAAASRGYLGQAFIDEGIDPRRGNAFTDDEISRLISRLQSYGPRQEQSYSSDDCGDGGEYVRRGL